MASKGAYKALYLSSSLTRTPVPTLEDPRYSLNS
ncbi:uncharacterized protein G2W53_018252 [Senna tora]|uniref:Uncharacterized protein n=1 Tax=Senna tora TaxID=362788 RepID=A0A834WN57_9FABA|nr:uncharacterized protein G2W53_018252 [Senna tora]